MLKNIGLLIKKDYFTRYPFVTLLLIAYFLVVFPLIARQSWSDSNIVGFGSICVIGVALSLTALFGDNLILTKFEFKRVLITGILPVTRLEVVIARFTGTFLGIVGSAAVWGGLSLVEQAISGGTSKVFGFTPTLLCVSILAASIAAGVFMLISSIIQLGLVILLIGTFIIGCSEMASSIFTFFINQHQMSSLGLAGVLTASAGVTILLAALTYHLVKKDTLIA